MIELLLEPLVSERFRTDEKYRRWHLRVVNPLPGRRILGVAIPRLRSLARELARRTDAAELLSRFETAACAEAASAAESGTEASSSGRALRRTEAAESGTEASYDGRTGMREEASSSGRVWGRTEAAESGTEASYDGRTGGLTEEAGTSLCYEEMIVWGMVLNFAEIPLEERLKRVRRFVAHIDSWGVCDTFVADAKWFRKAWNGDGDLGAEDPKEHLWQFLQGYFESAEEFDVRFATVMAMTYCLTPRWLPRLLFRFDELDFSRIQSQYPNKPVPYYAKMAVAWCLATALAEYPDETRGYLRHSRLPEDVLRLYVRKARESFRTRDISPF